MIKSPLEILKRLINLGRKVKIFIFHEFEECIHVVTKEYDIWIENNLIF